MLLAGTCKTSATSGTLMPRASSSSARNLPGWMGSRAIAVSSRMIIANLNVERPVNFLRPLETHAPLLVDANAELSFTVAAQGLKAIAGQQPQVASADRRLQNIQTPLRLLLERLKLSDAFPCGKTLRALVTILGRNDRLCQPVHALLWQN